jgi:hypothetical protein
MVRVRHPLAVLIVVGIAIRVAIAFSTGGLPYDIGSWRILRASVAAHPLHFYALVNSGGGFHWPYPPGFLPFMLAMSGVADLFGGFTHLVRLPAIAADAALTIAVYHGLGGRTSERRRLTAAALVALGPVFITISGYAAQIDAVAILPCVLAVLVWERLPSPRRALAAGLLIGLGGAIKTVPLITVLALAPTVRDRREFATLLVAAASVMVAVLLPFLLADAAAVRHIAHYEGAPGVGGLSLVAQPDLAARWLSYSVPATDRIRFLFVDHATLLNFAILGAFAVYGSIVRPPPRRAAALLFLLLVTFGSGFFFQYLVWVLPFLLLAGHLWGAAALQAVTTVPMLIFYAGPWHAHSIVWVYVLLMLLAWAGWAVGAAGLARRGLIAARSAA